MSTHDDTVLLAENFAANLRFLCERSGSISDVCRKMKINRQQFNKYMSGLHIPSMQNRRLIAQYFGLSPEVLFVANEEFRMLIEGNYFYALETFRHAARFSSFLETSLLHQRSAGDGHIGIYDRYQYSSIYRGKILRAAFCLYRNRDFLQHYYVERFPSFDRPTKADYVFKYHGFTIPLDGRMFSVDFEVGQKNEMTFGIYAPVRRSAKNFMFGITSGIAATMLRPPYATKVAMHYQGPGMLRKEHLKRVTTLEENDPSIPVEVRQFLGSDEMLPRSGLAGPKR
jgi:transcriptional regulator with XRE-family HTH domain